MLPRLVPASPNPPPGLADLLADLGPDGENGFTGTPVGGGTESLDAYLLRCCAMTDPARLPAGRVPQTVYWFLDEDGEAIGTVRLRHHLNAGLRIHGGHCGYYLRRDRRGRGYGKRMLALAKEELRRLGEPRMLVTTDPDNRASIAVVTANGGTFDGFSHEPETGRRYRRFWIDL